MSTTNLAYSFNTTGQLQSVTEEAAEMSKPRAFIQAPWGFGPLEHQKTQLAKTINRYAGADFSKMRRRDVQRYLALYAKAKRWGLIQDKPAVVEGGGMPKHIKV
jgi:hypothetical protein